MMKKSMIPFLAFVVVGLAGCETMPDSESSSASASQQGSVSSLEDLIGARGRSGEEQMEQRGYTWVRTDKSGGSAYSYWREQRSGQCVSVRTTEGRYASIVYTPDFDCRVR